MGAGDKAAWSEDGGSGVCPRILVLRRNVCVASMTALLLSACCSIVVLLVCGDFQIHQHSFVSFLRAVCSI